MPAKKNPARNPLANLPTNALIQFPSGRWGFVGSVDARLLFTTREGAAPTDEQLADAARFGSGLVGLRTRAWDTAAEAEAAATALGQVVTHPVSRNA